MTVNTAVMSVPTMDGTTLQVWLRPDRRERFTPDSMIQFVEDTDNGYRPLVSYQVSSLLQMSSQILRLHDREPGLTIERHWLTALLDWIQLFTEWSTERPELIDNGNRQGTS